MAFVLISRQLRSQLGSNFADQLGVDFSYYKQNPSSFGDIFGRDKPNDHPTNAKKLGIYHVHMEVPYPSQKWESIHKNWQPGVDSQDSFTSNKMLMYCRAQWSYMTPYVLISILNPGGHRQMRDDAVMNGVVADFHSEVNYYNALSQNQKQALLLIYT